MWDMEGEAWSLPSSSLRVPIPLQAPEQKADALNTEEMFKIFS